LVTCTGGSRLVLLAGALQLTLVVNIVFLTKAVSIFITMDSQQVLVAAILVSFSWALNYHKQAELLGKKKFDPADEVKLKSIN